MTSITCMCEKTFEADIPESVDFLKNPEIKSRILTGRFMTFNCPHCGSEVKPEFPLEILNTGLGGGLFLIPEMERNRFLLGMTEYEGHDRVVIGYRELVEKVKIIEAGLDDRVIELIKYYLLVKAGPGTDPVILFESASGEDISLEIHGLKEGEIGMAKIPVSVYNKMAADLLDKSKEEPFKTILTPPYVSISKVELEEE